MIGGVCGGGRVEERRRRRRRRRNGKEEGTRTDAHSHTNKVRAVVQRDIKPILAVFRK